MNKKAILQYHRFFIVVLIVAILGNSDALAQCIATYPYHEDFETAPSWTTGGTRSSWAWGTPQKNIINTAGSGQRCWITGGLTGSAYNDGENSYLLSPCFDFTQVQYPLISFSYFCVTEQRYDGARVEYSIDGGNTWTALGTYNEDRCISSNWYNTQTLYQQGSGWSGNTGGWTFGRHAMPQVAGRSNVRIRFLFSAGTQQNAYNGFAVDNIVISNTQPNTADFSYSCANANTVSFSNLSSLCGTFQWNFGDPQSGSNNTSTAENPTHTFATAGTHHVSMTATFPNNNVVIGIVKDISIIHAAGSVATPISCNGGSNGAVTVNASGSDGSYTYLWNNGAATPTISSLIAGSYTVNVSAANSCGALANIILDEPSALLISLLPQDAKCGNSNGKITATAQGGIPDYTYLWDNGATTAAIQGLAPKTYNLTVTDANNCQATATTTIQNQNSNLTISLGNDTAFCPGGKLLLHPGTFAQYLWQDNSTAPTYLVSATGHYSVKVTDADGCSATDDINVAVDCNEIYFPSGFTPNNDNINDRFGPLGNIGAIKDYQLVIYNRWGQKVFISNNALDQWDGRIRGNPAESGTYIWMAKFRYNNQSRAQKGTISLVR